MRCAFFKSVMCSVCFVLLYGCRDHTNNAGSDIVVTNTYLQSAVLDLDPTQKRVDTLAGPGMCPGHFDMTAGTMDRLRRAKVLLRFDFQAGLDEQLVRLRRNGLCVRPIQAMKGLSVPASYVSVCEQTATALGEQYPERKEDFHHHMERIRERQKRLEAWVRDRLPAAVSDGDVCVVSSGHQAEFARWLGLNVVGAFSGSDQASPVEIAECLKAGTQQRIRLVIANQQEGTALAQSLSERLGAKVVIFSNFPEASDDRCLEPAFDVLVRENIRSLLEALN